METKQKHFFSRESIEAIPWIIVSKILTALIYIPISILIVRGMPPRDYGIYTLCHSIADYIVVICSLGFNSALLRFIPELAGQQNRAGLKRLLIRSAIIEGIALMISPLIILGGALFFFDGFSLTFILPTTMLGVGLLARDYLSSSYTAFYRSRIIANMSLLQGILLLSIIMVFFVTSSMTVEGVLYGKGVSFLVISFFYAIALFHYINTLQGASYHSVGKRRFLSLALPMFVSNVTTLLIHNYTEIFFLGYFQGAVAVSYYAVGYFLPYTLLSIIPLTLYNLFTSAFCEAYAKEPSSLQNLIRGMYQILIVISVPIAAFGFFFMPAMIEVLYGAKMSPAGPVGSIFSLVHLLFLFSIPLSMSITATEKTLYSLWLSFVQIAVNIVLDYYLIKTFGIEGAVGAVFGTFIITLPFLVFMIRRFVGGVYFPWFFFIRIGLTAFVSSFLSWKLFQSPGFVFLGIAALSYLMLFMISLKIFRIVRHQDVIHFHALNFKLLNSILNFFTNTEEEKIP